MTLAGRLTSFLPHTQLPVPLRHNPRLRLSLYIDCELQQALVHEQAVLREFQSLLSPGDVVFDVGANIGLYSVTALAKPGVTVYAFEPDLKVANRIKENQRLNGFESARLTIVTKAIWDETGEIDIALKDTRESNSLVRTEDARAHQTVESVRLDDFVASNGVYPDVVKIDVEHAGDAVLRGAQQVLEECRPRLILEVHDDDERQTYERLLAEQGYQFKQVAARHWSARPGNE